MAKKRIRTRSKSNKRRPYKKRTQKKRKKSTKRGGAAVNPAATDDPAPPLRFGPDPRQGQVRPRQKRQSLPEIPEGRVSPQIPAAPGPPPEQEQVQIPERQVGDCTPPNCENCKNTFEELECTGVERRSFSDEIGEGLTRTTNIPSEDQPLERTETVRREDQPLERTDSAETFGRTDSDVTLQRQRTPVLPGNTEEVERLIRNLISLLREEYKKYVDKYYSNENKTPEEKKQDYMNFLDEYYDIILNKEEDLFRLLQ